MSGAELMGDARPSSNRTATLTIDVDSGKSFTYDGTVGDGLSLNKTGAGTQSFTGTTTVNNITVQQVAEEMIEAYRNALGIETDYLITRPGEGARVLYKA